MLLVGDIGGTKTDLAVYSPDTGPRAPLAEAEFHSANYPSLEAMAREFIARVNLKIDRACFDVAGPVADRRAKVTNLPWIVDAQELTKNLGLKSVELLNDLEAVARAVPLLKPDDLRTLSAGQPVPRGPIAIVAPGTGLGEAFVTWTEAGPVAHASEGGHADFAPTTPTQIGLLQYLHERYDHVSFERVCSGIGIANIYEYLRDSSGIRELPRIAERLTPASDPTPIIVEAAFATPEPSLLSRAAIDTFVEILAGEAGNLALKVLATGGVYLGGGIPTRILPTLEDGRFLRAFQRKGRFTDFLARIPLHVITARVALIGAASYGLEQMTSTGR